MFFLKFFPCGVERMRRAEWGVGEWDSGGGGLGQGPQQWWCRLVWSCGTTLLVEVAALREGNSRWPCVRGRCAPGRWD